MSTKEEIIESLKNIKKNPIAPQKKDLTINSSGTKHRALMRYNAMLDNITLGAHSQKTITINGIEWTMRLLTGAEQTEIRKEVLKSAKKDDCFEQFNLSFLEMTKLLARSLSPSPFKTEGKEIWNEEDLGHLPYGTLEDLFAEYIDFDALSSQKPSDLSLEEVEELINIIKKKPEALKECERKKLLAISTYLLNSYREQEKIIKSAMNS